MSENDTSWFVLTVVPQHEATVEQHLQVKGFEVSVPKYAVRRRWSDRVKTITLPLFPGYVFCRFDPGSRVPVFNTPGVRGAICFAGRFAALKGDEMARIQQMAASGMSLEPLAGLRAGTRVKILDGPLHGVEGVLAHIDGSARVVVNVELLHRSVAVHVDSDAIAPALEAVPA